MGEPRCTEQEEALGIKSLRRIIAAYANYHDAAERDVKRYERSFKMLPPAHKELLSHLGLKYQRLRWCISMNAAFIMNMLQAFKPPFNMSQYIETDDHDCPVNMHEHSHEDCAHSSERGDHSRISISRSNSSLHVQHDGPKEDTQTYEFSKQTEKKKDEDDHMAGCSHAVGNNSGTLQGEGVSYNGDKDVSIRAYSQDKDHSASFGVENVTSWNCTASLFKLDVPPIDVDKVRWVIRNIVRDWAEEGQKERDECYKPILEELDRLFPNRSEQKVDLVQW
ncbi:hypothetical protein ACP4OV_016399 [Aristida adscensionis]